MAWACPFVYTNGQVLPVFVFWTSAVKDSQQASNRNETFANAVEYALY